MLLVLIIFIAHMFLISKLLSSTLDIKEGTGYFSGNWAVCATVVSAISLVNELGLILSLVLPYILLALVFGLIYVSNEDFSDNKP